jgi:hypothetical protein
MTCDGYVDGEWYGHQGVQVIEWPPLENLLTIDAEAWPKYTYDFHIGAGVSLDEVVAAVERIKGWAKSAYASAERETDSFGRRFIEHGAHCYANAAWEIEAVLRAAQEPDRVVMSEHAMTTWRAPEKQPVDPQPSPAKAGQMEHRIDYGTDDAAEFEMVRGTLQDAELRATEIARSPGVLAVWVDGLRFVLCEEEPEKQPEPPPPLVLREPMTYESIVQDIVQQLICDPLKAEIARFVETLEPQVRSRSEPAKSPLNGLLTEQTGRYAGLGFNGEE